MDLHYLQLEILKQISLNPNAPFSKIQNKEITSNLFAYHVKKLLHLKLVEKNKETYSLSLEGKKLVNELEIDKDVPVVTHQPKLSVLVYPFFGEDYTSEFIARKRLKEPFYGYIGTVSLRFRFGEKIEESIKKELKERVGFSFNELRRHGYLRIMNRLDGEVVEDKLFFIFSVHGLSGEFGDYADVDNFRISPKEYWNKTEKIYTGQREGWEIMTGERESGGTYSFDLEEF